MLNESYIVSVTRATARNANHWRRAAEFRLRSAALYRRRAELSYGIDASKRNAQAAAFYIETAHDSWLDAHRCQRNYVGMMADGRALHWTTRR